MSAARVAIVGGSVGGLSAALFLARRGHSVVVYERDGEPVPATAAEAGAWRRRSTPQTAHSHAFLARARTILAEEAPEVLDDMVAAGVREARLTEALPAALEGFVPAAGDDELVVLNARRSTFEWVLRRAVEREPGVEVQAGLPVTGLDVHANGARRVTGVMTSAGTTPADVVIDAAGKRSPLQGWLAADATGGQQPHLREVPCGISYLTRFYRLRGGEPLPLNRGFTHGASFDRYSCLVFPGDQGSFSVTFGVLPEDRDIRVLLDPAAFDAAAAAIESIAPWVDPEVARPISEVTLMSGLANVLRPPVAADVVGFHILGDAQCVTNPAHTRGTTLAFIAAQRLAEAITDHPGSPGDQAAMMAELVHGELAEWIDDTVAQDAARLARWRPDVEPEQPLWPRSVSNGEAYLAAQRDPEAWRAFTRLQNSLARPAEVLESADLADRVAAVVASGWRPAPAVAPDHDELIAIATAAAAAAAGT